MSRLLLRRGAPDSGGAVIRVTPASAGWAHVGFELVPLAAGETLARSGAAGRELCIVLVAGSAELEAGGVALGLLLGRASPFDDAPPGAAYLPAGMPFVLRAAGPCEVALCTAPGRPGQTPRIIPADRIGREVRGTGANARTVRNILPETEPADALLIAEVVTSGGHWSSYPPHKHDTAAPGLETALEETYYHRLLPSQGFAVQRVYTDDRSLDETLTVADGEVVLVPRGYHPVGVPPGYTSYYLNVMAGPDRHWRFQNDPAHAWIVEQAPSRPV